MPKQINSKPEHNLERLSIIIINFGTPDLILNFLHSLAIHPDSAIVHEIIVVDNGYPFKGDSRQVIKGNDFPIHINFVQNEGISYASGANRGAEMAKGEILIIANSDLKLLQQYSIKSLIEVFTVDPQVAVAAPQFIFPDASWQRSHGAFPSIKEALLCVFFLDSLSHILSRVLFSKNLLNKTIPVQYVDGAFMAIRRNCWEKLGGFDESYTFYGEDADFCWRTKQANWKVVFVPSVRIMHIRGASSTVKSLAKYSDKLLNSKKEFVAKHYNIIRAKWYEQIMKYAYFERAVLFNALAKLTNLSIWKKRASEAKERYKGVI